MTDDEDYYYPTPAEIEAHRKHYDEWQQRRRKKADRNGWLQFIGFSFLTIALWGYMIFY